MFTQTLTLFFIVLVNMTEYFTASGKTENTFYKITSLWKYGIITTKFAFDSPVVKNFIENDRTPFDLVISEQFQQEAFNMFSHKYNCPLMVLGTLDCTDFMDRAKGAMTPWSHVPHFFSHSTDRMTFLQRIENTAYSLYDAIGRKFYYLPKQTELARVAFQSLENQQGGRLPSTEDLEKKISVHLINAHSALSYPRPKMPGMIDIAGIHIRPSKPLPDDIKTFLDGAKDGVVYVSFGTFLKSSEMPPQMLKAMVDAFRKLKQRVVWKFEIEAITDMPSNVLVKSWLPQSDILAHKNVKLFISHGGLFGTQESIYHAVPMIVFPFYGDQHLNGNRMEQRGIAMLQAMNEMTSESLVSAINKIVNNESYYKKIRLMSDIFRTNQNSPLDTAIWWIEYVIKYNGAPHLQSAAKNLPWFRYLQLDLAFVIFGVIYIIYDLLSKKSDSKKPEIKSEAKKSDAKKEAKKSDVKKSLPNPDSPPKKKNKNKKKEL